MNQSQHPQRPARPSHPVPPPQKKKRKFPFWTLPVIVLCACLLTGAYVFADEQLNNYAKFNTMRAAIAGDTFFGPVSVDGIALNGMTLDEANQALSATQAAKAGSFELFLTSGGSTWRITSEEVPMSWNTDVLLQKAYMVGRVGTLEERYAQVRGITSPVNLVSEFVYDKKTVRTLTDRVAMKLTLPSENAAVVAFDVNRRSFAFSDEVAGQAVDADALYDTVISYLDQERYGETIPVQVTPKTPEVTRAMLERDYKRIAEYSTKTTKDENRNTNIRLAADALNGKMIPPGETISFNETTGQRTLAKGYQSAGAIENGRTIQEVGGGVCQVSSTLFNALVRADCEIVRRKPHAWPSDYVPRGEDATVDWPDLDLVMRNPTSTPMFVTAWYTDQHVYVEVYGLSLGDGVSIDLKSETTYEKKPTETIYTYNPTLAIGTEKLLKKPHTGYTVETYKIQYKDGQEMNRAKLYTSEYKVINEEYEYNDGNPPPTL